MRRTFREGGECRRKSTDDISVQRMHSDRLQEAGGESTEGPLHPDSGDPTLTWWGLPVGEGGFRGREDVEAVIEG